MRRSIGLAVFAGCLLVGPLQAQGDETAVLRPVLRLFEAMRSKDTAALRAVFHPDARLTATSGRGSDSVSVVTVDGFVTAVARARVDLDEQIWDWEVRIDGPLAAVWTKYDFMAGGQFSHCGVDAFHLARVGGEWKIVHLADTRRTAECWRRPSG